MRLSLSQGLGNEAISESTAGNSGRLLTAPSETGLSPTDRPKHGGLSCRISRVRASYDPMAPRSDPLRANSSEIGPLSHPSPENGNVSDQWLGKGGGVRPTARKRSGFRPMARQRGRVRPKTREQWVFFRWFRDEVAPDCGSEDAAVSVQRARKSSCPVRMARKSGHLQWNASRLYLFVLAGPALAFYCFVVAVSCRVRLLQFPFPAVH
jgi:hypothetical protein